VTPRVRPLPLDPSYGMAKCMGLVEGDGVLSCRMVAHRVACSVRRLRRLGGSDFWGRRVSCRIPTSRDVREGEMRWASRGKAVSHRAMHLRIMWRGMAWHGMASHGVAWHGMEWRNGLG
jgi:hypothetical protein